MLRIPDPADRRVAIDMHSTNLARRELHLGDIPFFRHQLCGCTGATHHLSATALFELDIVNESTERYLANRERVAEIDRDIFSGSDGITHLQPRGPEDVALLAVGIVEKADPGGTVRIVLDAHYFRRNFELVAPEIYLAIASTMPASTEAHSGTPTVIATAAPACAP